VNLVAWKLIGKRVPQNRVALEVTAAHSAQMPCVTPLGYENCQRFLIDRSAYLDTSGRQLPELLYEIVGYDHIGEPKTGEHGLAEGTHVDHRRIVGQSLQSG